jgi:hypothetical protein
MTIRTAVLTVFGCTILFSALGAGIGLCLGKYAPDFYRSPYRDRDRVERDPVSVGVGLGVSQGMAGGVAVGLILVALFVWRDTRLVTPTPLPTPAATPTTEPPVPTARSYAVKVFAPWGVLAVGIMAIEGYPTPGSKYAMEYPVLFLCLFVILWQLGSEVRRLSRSVERRRSRAAWVFLFACFVNMTLIGRLG